MPVTRRDKLIATEWVSGEQKMEKVPNNKRSSVKANNSFAIPPKDSREKKMKIKPYNSLFVVKANLRAQERAQEAKRKLQDERDKYNIRFQISGWDSTPATNNVFDSKMHKQEIFKLQKRVPSPESVRRGRPPSVTGLLPGQSLDRSITPGRSGSPVDLRGRPPFVTGISPRQSYERSVTPNGERSKSDGERNKLNTQPTRSGNEPSNHQRMTMRTKDVSPRINPSKQVNQQSNNNKVLRDSVQSDRASSPIDERIIFHVLKDKLQQEQQRQQHRHTDSGTNDYDREPPVNTANHPHNQRFFVQSSQSDFPGQQQQQEQQQEYPRDRQHYRDLIKMKLRNILHQHVRNKPHHPTYNSSSSKQYAQPPQPPISSSSHGNSRYITRVDALQRYNSMANEQAFNREMLSSMATIFQSVADIVVTTNQTQQRCAQQLFTSKRMDRYQQNKHQFKQPPTQYTSYPTNHTISDNVHHQQQQQQQHPTSQPSTANREKEPNMSSGQLAMEMTKLFHSQPELPKSKSAVLDMILQKIQKIDETEQETREFLKQMYSPSNSSAKTNNNHTAKKEKPISTTTGDYYTANNFMLPMDVEKGKNALAHALAGDYLGKQTYNDQEKVIDNEKDGNAKATIVDDKNINTNINTITKVSNRVKEDAVIEKWLSVTPRLYCPGESHFTTFEYIEEMDKARKLKDVGFTMRNSSTTIAMESISDMLMDKLMRSIVKEYEQFTEDYAEKFLETI